MKKKISFILFICILFAELTFPMGIAHAATYGIFTYTYSTFYREAKIIDCDASASGSIEIPDYIDGYPVTSIGNYAFENCSSLTSITIPDSVTSIGNDAFYGCSNLEEVHISDIVAWCNISFERDYSNPLYYAKKLYLNNELVRDLTIPDSVTSIGSYAFYNCSSFTSITMPDSVTNIGNSAFSGCSSLEEVHISDITAWCNISFSSGASNPLYYAKKLYLNNEIVRDLTIPDSVTRISGYTFYNCSSLTSITIPDSVTSIGDYAFSGCSSLSSITIPDSVTSIGGSAFYNCSSLTRVTIPNSVTSIGGSAFYNCSSLTSITIPKNVTSIWGYAFYGCSSLTSVNMLSGVKSIGDYAFSFCSSLTNIIIPDSITSIGYDAFSFCRSLKSITIPDSVTSIGERAFYSCSSLEEVHISDITAWCNISFKYYDSNPLYYAKKLYLNNEIVRDLTIPDSVTRISGYTFYNCSSLTSITIPDSVTNIGGSAFSGCSSLEEVHISDITAWCNISFSSGASNPLYYAKKLYLNNELVRDLTIPDSVTSIGTYAFYGCSSLTSITIPDSVTSIGYNAFTYCSSLASITIPDSVTSIGSYAFYNCSSLASIAIPDSVTSIGKYAFYNCSSLASITIPDSVTSIGSYTFYNCSNLTSITIPNSVTSIGGSAFYNCSSLASITIPVSVTSIDIHAFFDCTSLENLYYGGMQEDWNKIKFGSSAIPKSTLIHYLTYVTGISLDKESVNLIKGNKKLLTATITPEDATNKNIVWSTSDENIAVVENGLVTAVSAGTATITATTEDGGYNSSCKVTVKEHTTETDFQFENGTITRYIGTDAEIIVPETISGAKVITIGAYAFSGCSITSVMLPNCVEVIEDNAFINSSLTDLYYDGTTNDWEKVTVGTNAIPDNVIIHHNIGVTNISLDKTKISMFMNKTAKLTAVIKPDNAYNKKIVWTSSDESVATVENGIITPISLGQTIITATAEDGGYCASCTVLVCTDPSNFEFDNGTIKRCYGASGKVVIPDTINNIPVTSIGEYAFANSQVTSVIIPNGVTSIGDYAFCECWSLTDITISDSVKNIGSNAFSICKSLVNINIPNSVTDIGDHAFYKCTSLTSITIPNSVTSIGSSVFFGCTSLNDVTMADSVTSISASAFSGCTNLMNIIIPDSVVSIEYEAFQDCTSLASITIPDSVTSIGDSAFKNCSSLTRVTIPNSVTSIGMNAFYGCSNLEEVHISDIVAWCNISFKYDDSNPLYYAKKLYLNNEIVRDLTIPDRVTRISGYTFKNCSSLTSITIPNSVTEIGDYAFSGCSNLTSIIIPCSIKSLNYALFSGCSSLTNITIPNSVTEIGDYAFYNCSSLTCVTIPDSVTSIGSYAFYNCSSLTSITIPDSVVSIAERAFSGCSNIEEVYISDITAWCNIYFEDSSYTGGNSSNPLIYAKKLYLNNELVTDLVIPDGVTSVNRAFIGFGGFKSITIPASLESIGYEEFENCKQLDAIYISDMAAWCSIDFNNSNPLRYAKNLYLNNELVTDLVIPDSVSSIEDDAFYGCNSITSVVISNNVITIGNNAFRDCINLKDIKLGYGVEDIKKNAFLGCSNIKKITLDKNNTNYVLQDDVLYNSSKTQLILYPYGSEKTIFDIPNTVEKINNIAFKNCKNLKSLTIPGSIKNLDNGLFSGCISLTNVTILSGVTSVGAYAFYNCSSLASITIPGSVTSIGVSAFSGCSSLASITIPDSVTRISECTFYNCSSLASITIPGSVTSIDSSAFYNCSSLASITIPDNVTSIADHAFSGCSSLSSINMPNSITSMGKYAFQDCINLTSIIIPDNVKSIGYEAFDGCSGLTSLTIPASVTSMGNDVLYPTNTLGYCAKLVEISVDENNSNYSSQDGVLFNKQKTTLIKYPEGNLRTTYNIPSTVTEIRVGAFCGCNKLEYIHVPDSVTKIDTGYFYTLPFICTKLAEISVDENNSNYSSQDGVLFNKQKTTLIEYPKGNLRTTYSIPDSVTSIGRYAFENCRNLTSIIIPDSVTSIGQHEFYNCRNLTSITIPNSVTSIGLDAFGGSSLSDVYYSGSEFDRGKMNIDSVNNTLLNATWHYGSSTSTDAQVIKAEDISGKPGETVKIDIMLENNPGTAIIGFNIGYDGNAMTLASVTNGEIFDDADILNGNIQKNPYMFTCMNSTENKNGDGILISLTFNIADNCPAGDYTVNISGCEAYSIDESAINFKTISGKVTVSDGTGAGINISVSIPNHEKGGTVMAALYDNLGKLLSVQSYAPAESVNVSFEQSGAYIKVMHWNMDSMIPLSPVQLIIPADIPNYQKGGTVMTALYDKSGKLLNVKSYVPSETINISFEQNGAYIKVMQWDMNTLKPLDQVKVINIE